MVSTAKTEQSDMDQNQEFTKAKQAAREAFENFVEAKRHLKAAAREAGIDFRDNANDQLDDALARVLEEKQRAMKTSEEYIRENPLTSASIAFLAGFVISKFMGK